MQSVNVAHGSLADTWRQDPCSALYELSRRLPGESIQLDFGLDEVIVIQDTESAQQVLGAPDGRYKKHFALFEAFFGRSRLTTDGAEWQRLQRLSQPFIARSPVDKIVQATVNAYGEAVVGLQAMAPFGPVRIDQALDTAAAKVVSERVLGFPLSSLGPSALEDFRILLKLAMRNTWNIGILNRQVDPDEIATAQGARDRLAEATRKLIAARVSEGSAETSLLHAIALADPPIDVLGEICTLVFAGFDTTSTAIGWCLFLLASHPELQERLRRDVRSVQVPVGWTADGLDRLSTLTAFINEALRIFPPVPILSRVATAPDTLAGTSIQPGQKVLVSIIGLHHDHTRYDRPQRIDLDRQSHAMTDRQPGFFPFGVGRRHCGGARFATLEMAAALATMLSRLSFRLPAQRPLQFEWTASLRRKGGQHLLVTRAA